MSDGKMKCTLKEAILKLMWDGSKQFDSRAMYDWQVENNVNEETFIAAVFERYGFPPESALPTLKKLKKENPLHPLEDLMWGVLVREGWIYEVMP